MKLLFFLLSIFWAGSLTAQYTPPSNLPNKPNRRLWISPKHIPAEYLKIADLYLSNEEPKRMMDENIDFRKSSLLDLKENSVIILTKGSQPVPIEIPVEYIDVFKFRKKDSKMIGLLAGVASGLLASIIIEPASKEVCSSSPLGWLFGNPGRIVCYEVKRDLFSYGFVGGLVGITVGSFKKKIYINGQQASYEQQRQKLQRYLLVQ